MDELNKIPSVRVFQSCANFVPVRIEYVDMQELKEALKQNGILIRLFEDRSESVARIAIADREIMENVAKTIEGFVRK